MVGMTEEQRSEYARYVQSQRKKYEGTCKLCRATFTGYQRKEFCSPQHKALWHYRKKRGQADVDAPAP